MNPLPGASKKQSIALPALFYPMRFRERKAPFHADGWIYEEKYDGFRIVAFKLGSEVCTS